ncbi:MAG: beta strand repeat-containing protein [Planctomycetaceae bacterium]
MSGLWKGLLRSWKNKGFGLGRGVRKARRTRVNVLAGTQVLETRALLSASVVTDLQDYSPGNVAAISAWNSDDGSNENTFDWAQAVQFEVIRTDGVAAEANGNLPWLVRDGEAGFAGYFVDADLDGDSDYGVFPDTDGLADGRVGTTWYVEEQYAGSTLRLIASQSANPESGFAGAVATHDFTDNATVAIDSPSTNANQSITAGTNFTIQYDAATSSVPSRTQTSATLTAALETGSGTTVTSYSLGSKSWTGSTLVSVTNDLWTVTIPSSVPAGTYRLRLTMTQYLSDSSTRDATASANNAVVVAAAAGTGSLSVSAQQGAATYGSPTDSVTFDVVANRTANGNFTGAYTVSGLPSGVTPSFAPQSFNTSTGTNDLPDSVLTLTVGGTVAAGDYPFVVTLTNSSSGGGSFTANGTLTVARKTITGSFTVSNKTYDGTTAATVTAISLSGVEGTDTISLTGGTATFDSANVGTSRTVTLAGATLSGTAAANYTLGTISTTTANINQATATVVVAAYDTTYNGSSQTASVTSITGVNGETGATVGTVDVSGTTHTNAGIYNDTWAFTGTSNYTSFTQAIVNKIVKAKATVTVSGYTGGIYDTTAHTQSVSVVGVGSDGELFTDSLTATNAGSYSQPWSYSNPNYDDVSGTLAFDIAKAALTVTVSGYTGGIYDTTAHTQSVSVVGVGSDGELFTDSLTATNAGSYSQPWSYSNPNYDDVSGTLAFNIARATASVVVSGYTGGEFDTQAHTQTVTVTGVGSDGILFTKSLTGTNAGSYSQAWSYGNSNYSPNPMTGTLAFVITARDANVAYIGSTYWVTSGSSSTAAQVTLSASLQDPTGVGLQGALVSFYDLTSGTPKLLAANVKVSPVAGNTSTGTASTTVTLSTGQYGAESYLIQTIVTGNYTNVDQPGDDKLVTISVVQPAGVNSIKGAGQLAKLSSAVGTYAPSDTATFAAGVSYNKNLTNVQGSIKLWLPQADGSTIYIKSNSLTSMAAANLSVGKVYTVYSKASIIRVQADGTMVSLEGNVVLRFDLVGSGTSARVGFTVLSGSALRYSNNWVYDTIAKAWKTDFQGLVLGSGGLMVG